MAIAVTADVKRILQRSDDAIDAQLRPVLEAAEQWVREHTHREWDRSGSVTETFFNRRQGKTLRLDDIAPKSITSVTTYLTADATGTLLTADTDYQLEDKGKLHWYFNNLRSPVGLPGASVRVLPVVYAKVVVVYKARGQVPAPVREATAIIAAASYNGSKVAISGKRSERMGDYSYTRDTKGSGGVIVPQEALVYLSRYINHRARTVN